MKCFSRGVAVSQLTKKASFGSMIVKYSQACWTVKLIVSHKKNPSISLASYEFRNKQTSFLIHSHTHKYNMSYLNALTQTSLDFVPII